LRSTERLRLVPYLTSVPAALCLNHPRREAAARCTSCGQPFCRECVTDFEGRMVCSACHREKTKAGDKKKRDWFLITTVLQASAGLAALWLTAWLLGRLLVSIPSEVHEGEFWNRLNL
jgi:hypothetical protein